MHRCADWREHFADLGLVGLGAIGSRVAALANLLGMRVIGHDPHVSGDVAGVERMSLEDLLRSCDVLSLHARSSGPGRLPGRAADAG